jgi:succinate dehydrogenase/fumarate reductase flavoprotein subunit
MSVFKSGKGATGEYPYPVAYGNENRIEADVLVLGGGVAGCHAAIAAARRGAKVVVVDKGPVIRSGSGGAGVDHWHGACTNPASTVPPEEMIELTLHGDYLLNWEFGNGITSYILFKESYDALMDVESWGVKVRDVDDEFKDAEFRDEKTKLTFAYDYDSRHCIRVVGGSGVKVAYYNEMKRLGVQIHDFVMVTRLLTKGGRQGGRVVGATGVHVRNGGFYIFKAKVTILATGVTAGMWIFSTELAGSAASHGDPNNVGDGTAMAWRAGAELALMEKTSPMPVSGGFTYPMYGTGNAHNTWYACTMVDFNGKEIPWVDRDGKILATVSERYHRAPGQKAFFNGPNLPYEIQSPRLIPDLPERIKNGEYVLPLYADLPSMPAHERRAIWGLMIPHEGKCHIIYDTYQKAGFDPDRDMLMTNVMPPDRYFFYPYWNTMGPRQWREGPGGGGLLFDWDLKTNLEALYVAGTAGYAGGNHAGSASTGRYAGRKAVEYLKSADAPSLSREQIREEKARVYGPVTRDEGIGWKELRAGLARIMQDYLGEYKNAETLQMGLAWLDSIRESEAARAYARNPHELVRVLECYSRLDAAEVMIRASLERKASSRSLGFYRLDYPQLDPPEWTKLITLRLEDGEVKTGEHPVDYYLKAPCAASFEENYRDHCGLQASARHGRP